jgi:hypothetical protein
MSKKDIVITLDNMSETDKELTADEIMEYIISLVKQAERIKALTAKSKEGYVMKEIRKVVGVDAFHRYESMFEGAIHLICKLGKNPKILKGINDGVKICLLPCLKKCC